MSSIVVGQTAPSFRLPSAQGPEIGPEDYRGKKNVIAWFTKGMACPFCRQHMSQLARGYPQFQTLDAEILEITNTPPARAKIYLEKFSIPFPYLCDPDYRASRAWELGVRSHSLVWYAQKLYKGLTSPMPDNDYGKFMPPVPEMPAVLTDQDAGFFVLDKQGIVRYAITGAYGDAGGVRPIPSNDEILRELERCKSSG